MKINIRHNSNSHLQSSQLAQSFIPSPVQSTTAYILDPYHFSSLSTTKANTTSSSYPSEIASLHCQQLLDAFLQIEPISQ
ncbi:hypothetical protein C5167_048569 [Papaver somniferum]|uniref:Uncharacterized protein n=1 Tax=Papaver somniferum TaxID=3469 RepID=A0A4Y7KL80_PAPSO|nr:hypothetical protein C5167_048569 [Papaver somniferum]